MGRPYKKEGEAMRRLYKKGRSASKGDAIGLSRLSVRNRPAVPSWRGSSGLALLEPRGAVHPPLGHPVPRGLALRVAGELRHLLAIGGMLEKFVGRVHPRILDVGTQEAGISRGL